MAPLVPVDSAGLVEEPYIRIVAGSAIDGMRGVHPFNLVHLAETKVKFPRSGREYGPQLSVALLEPDKASENAPVQVVELEAGDDWRMIYAACLGLLPEAPDADLLAACNLIPDLTFERFIQVDRVKVKGSFTDLLQRLNSREHWTPRKLSMYRLAYGNSGSTGIRTGNKILPDPSFARHDAGPNVIVICSPNSVEDAALLWNLRAANGDSTLLPIGIPISEVNAELIRTLMREPGISRNGIPVNSSYLTSASLSPSTIASLVGDDIPRIGIASYEEILHLGHPGALYREEVLPWKGGRTRFVSLPPDDHRELFTKVGFGRLTRMHADIHVLEAPFPDGSDTRSTALNGTFRAGVFSIDSVPNRRSEVRALTWPSSLLMARAIAAGRQMELAESEPGRAARILLEGLGGIAELGNLAHAPLLTMLEEMAARQGFGWYKNRLRQIGNHADPISTVGPTTDELPEKTFNELKKAFRNSDKATKKWLFWAEKSHLILKGFQLTCPSCDAKQWVPIAGFASPMTCRGCTFEMTTPFGDRTNVEFRYRLSERLRRVYEQDAMGHLLVARYLAHVLGSGKEGRLIGLHPGIEVTIKGQKKPEGEADVLLFTKAADFVPVEVKRTHSGFTDREIEKLDNLTSFLRSPWSAVAICQYAKNVEHSFSDLSKRSPDGSYSRVALSYDKLLGRPFWAINSDPFAYTPMSPEEIEAREKDFVHRLAMQAEGGPDDWLESELLDPPGKVT
ncbi:hypothetical protein [Streptomyces sp. WAC 04229]|uniref:hypothetical protein n=1 Tax=Streptomyces sp. WAC 04229 TaxID=2203206 RepID=UPI003D7503FC